MAAEPNKGSITPQSLVTEESVKNVLLVDKGKDAQLISWEVVDFTKLGDNYASVVSSVHVKYSLNGKQQDNVVYIVKLNPCRGSDAVRAMNNVLFMKESKFYLELLPEINSVLNSLGEPTLNYPRCFHAIMDMNVEQIYFEDLRAKGFKMFDRRKGQDLAHVSLVLKELARLHSASVLLQDKYPQSLIVNHDYLLKDFMTFTESSKEVMLPMLEANLANAVQMLEKIGGYEKAITWVKSLKPQLEEIFSTGLRNNKYDLVCHGDCWNNNMLFRYNSEGDPVQVMLLDLQLCRFASPTTDLNFFMYTSITGDVRIPSLKSFLSLYYSTFRKVMDAGGASMPFSEEELLKEFRAKNKIGAIFSMMAVPLLLMEPEEIPDVSQADNFLEDLLKQSRDRALEMLDSNPLTKPRFLATFDEMMETGLIS